MKFSAQKDNRRRIVYSKYELERNISKALLLENTNKLTGVSDMGKHCTKQRVKNRCVLTSRAKGIMSFFKLSRITFKEKASFGQISGIRKSSW